MKGLSGTQSVGLIFIWLAILLNHKVEGKIGCKDMSGNDVDWWVVLKGPVEPGSDDTNALDGVAYSYTDAANPLFETKFGIEEDTGAVYSTLQQVYNNRNNADNVAWFYYNDEDPYTGTSHSSYGHNKGIASFDDNTGFWLVHSVPRWPNSAETPFYFPDNETKYAQSFICVTYDYLTFNDIGSQWKINKPYMYDTNLPSQFDADLPNVVDVLNHVFVTTVVANQTLVLTSNGNENFLSFAKNAKWGLDLYEYLVAPTINSDLQVESWMNGANPLPSYCTSQNASYAYNVRNVREILLGDMDYTETKDHSKWCVSEVGQWTCVGDINRQQGQTNRAGGTVCYQDSQLWKDMYSLIISVDSC